MGKMDALAELGDSVENQFSLCLLDLDSFKAVNDENGHEVGDAVLVEVAARLNQCVSPSHSVARWGGEEFMALLPEEDLHAALDLAEKIRRALEAAPVNHRGLQIRIAASFGVSAHGSGYRTIRATLRAADKALYVAKHQGGNQVCCEDLVSDVAHQT